MPEDITLAFDDYAEQLLFCKYFIANKLVCLHRNTPASDDHSKQFLFRKDGQ
ncbi:MAG: hypothetical protein Q4G07_08015 [Oscillospiraceae bacterium]|nr:hypothetical protein [Oscillospiraceae bacterium]